VTNIKLEYEIKGKVTAENGIFGQQGIGESAFIKLEGI
jgi:hypothetical protein